MLQSAEGLIDVDISKQNLSYNQNRKVFFEDNIFLIFLDYNQNIFLIYFSNVLCSGEFLFYLLSDLIEVFCKPLVARKLNPLSAKITKWSNTLEKFVGNLLTNCLSVFDHFVGLALKGLKNKVLISDTQKVLACTSVYFYHREAYLESCNCFFTLF